MHDAEQVLQFGAAIQARHSVQGHGRLHLLEQAGHAHLEEFIQIVGDYGQKVQALQQRVFRIAGLRQNAPVESQPREIPIDIAGLVGLSRVRQGLHANLRCRDQRVSRAKSGQAEALGPCEVMARSASPAFRQSPLSGVRQASNFPDTSHCRATPSRTPPV